MNKKYFLSSMESYILQDVREVEILRETKLENGRDALLAKIQPKLPNDHNWSDSTSSTVVFCHRHDGYSLTPIKEFPAFVHVCFIKNTDLLANDLKSHELEHFAWGELYRTEEDAKSHRFD